MAILHLSVSSLSSSENVKDEKKGFPNLNEVYADSDILTVLNTKWFLCGSINRSSPIFPREWNARAKTEENSRLGYIIFVMSIVW